MEFAKKIYICTYCGETRVCIESRRCYSAKGRGDVRYSTSPTGAEEGRKVLQEERRRQAAVEFGGRSRLPQNNSQDSRGSFRRQPHGMLRERDLNSKTIKSFLRAIKFFY